MQTSAEAAAALLRSLSHPKRLLMLCALSEREHSAGELEELAGLSQSAVSQHLARLRRDGLATSRRAGQTIIYTLADTNGREIVETLHRLYCEEPRK